MMKSFRDIVEEIKVKKNTEGEESTSTDINKNIKSAQRGGVIAPDEDTSEFSIQKLKKILALADPATIEVIAIQYLADKGYKVVKI